MKQKQIKRICAMLLAGVMAVGCLSGCGSTDTPAEGSSEATKKTDAGNSSEAENTETAEEEPVVLKVLAVASTANGDWNEIYFTKYLEEKFNVDLQVEMITSEADTKLPLVFASDDLPDIIVGGLSGSQVTQFGSEGYFIDMNDYLTEETAPNFYDMISKYPDALPGMREISGELYALRGVDLGIHNLGSSRMYINETWAQEILGKLPETLDEYYEYLVGVKERDMNGNGDPNDEIPVGGMYGDYEGWNVMTFLGYAFGFTRMNQEVIDGKVVYVPAEDNYKELLKFANKLYEEELLDPEFFTQASEQYKAKATDYRYGSVASAYISNDIPDAEIHKNYHFSVPLTSDYQDTPIATSVGTNLAGMLVVTKECENPEKVAEIYDFCLSEEGTILILHGPTVEALAQFNDAEPKYGYEFEWDDRFLYWEAIYDESKYDNPTAALQAEWAPYGIWPSFRQFVPRRGTPETAGYDLTNETQDHHEPYMVVRWPDRVIKYTAEQTDALALCSVDISSYKDEMVTKFIIGELDIEKNWDDYVQGLKDRGLDTYLETHQAAYDAFVANK